MSRTIAAVAALIVIAIVIHYSALSGWWLYDDPQLLIESIRQPAGDILFNPAEYTHLAAHTFTPLLLLSFKLDLAMQGLRPTWFYAHQFVALTIAAVLFFFLLRRYVADIYAFAGAALFLTSWAAVYAARTLMIRHYVEGLVFALTALLLWSHALRRQRLALSWIAAAAYLIAMLCKEVYAPLPLLLICQARYEKHSWPQVLRDLMPPCVAAAVFLIWRWRMTGLVGAPSSILQTTTLGELPQNLWNHLVGPVPFWPRPIWIVATAAIILLFVWRQKWNAVAFLAASLVVVAIPVVSLASNLEWRYSFAFVAFVIGGLTIACGLIGRPWSIALLAALAVTTAITAIGTRRFYEQLTRTKVQAEGEYVWNQPATAAVLAAGSPAWYLEGLRWLRSYEHRGEAPRFIFSRYAILIGGVDAARVVAVDAGGHSVPLLSLPKTHRLLPLFGTPTEWQQESRRFDPAAPLTVDFRLSRHRAQWRLGPAAARFVFLTDPGFTAIPISQQGAQTVPAAREQQFFRIVRRESDGRWTVSPTLRVPADGATTVWERRAPAAKRAA